jgi:DNA modification methylase
MELNKIYNESCIETMHKMEDDFIDLIVTSPPYDNLRNYKGYNFDFENTAKLISRKLKQGGICVWVVGDATINGSETGTSFRQALYFIDYCDLRLHDTMIYRKKNPMVQTHNRYEQCFEYMFVFSKGKPKTFNPIKEKSLYAGTVKNRGLEVKSGLGENGVSRLREEKTVVKDEKYRHNIFEYAVGIEPETETGNHPAIFPELLAAEMIISWSNEGDLVYDCFGGSGTTAKMAHKLKRNWILSEISKEYVELAEKRIAPYLAQTTLF